MSYATYAQKSHSLMFLINPAFFFWTDINLNGVSTISDDVTAKDGSIQKIVNFVDYIERTNKEAKKRQEYASRIDRACFWGYLCLDILYGICITAITGTEFCKINNLDFWI